MTKIVFKNLERSELAVQLTEERLEEALARFPETRESKVTVTLSRENSPQQAGPDLFRVNVRLEGGRYGGIVIDKAASSLYVALAEICESLLERLNRFGDRSRVIARRQARRVTKHAI